MLTIGIILTVILRMKTKTNELIVNLLLGGKTSCIDIRLHQYSTNFAVLIFTKAYHAIRTRIKVFVMCLDALKERSEVVIRITKIVEFDNLRTIGRKIDFILRTSIEEVAKQVAVVEPTTLFFCPLFEPYQLD